MLTKALRINILRLRAGLNNRSSFAFSDDND